MRQFRTTTNMLSIPEKLSLKMVLLGNWNTDGRTYNLPTTLEVAALVVGDEGPEIQVCDIVLETSDDNLQHIMSCIYLTYLYNIPCSFLSVRLRMDIEMISNTQNQH